MSEKTYHWHKIADHLNAIPFQENNLVELEVGDKKICVGKKQQDKLFACASKCPHASGRLANGFLDAGGNIICPLHRYRFNTENGRNVSGEGYFLKTYVVEQRDDGIYVGFEKNKGLFGW